MVEEGLVGVTTASPEGEGEGEGEEGITITTEEGEGEEPMTGGTDTPSSLTTPPGGLEPNRL